MKYIKSHKQGTQRRYIQGKPDIGTLKSNC